jgi:adenylosuccinate lyase
MVQLGGAVGNKSAFGANGERISETLTTMLNLNNSKF